MIRFLVAAVGLGLVAAPISVLAQKTYRCGNTYQSYPCSAPAAGSKSDDKGKAAGASKPAVSNTDEKKPEAAKPVQSAEAKAQDDAVKAKKERCEKLRNDVAYNDAQLKRGGSAITMDRLQGERKQLDADMKKESC